MAGRTDRKEIALFAYSTTDASGAREAYSQRLVNCRAERSDQGVLQQLSSFNTNYYVRGTEGTRELFSTRTSSHLFNTRYQEMKAEKILGMKPVFFYNFAGKFLAVVTTRGLWLYQRTPVERLIKVGNFTLNNFVIGQERFTEPPYSIKPYIACNGFTIMITIPDTGEGFIYTPQAIPATLPTEGGDPTFPRIDGSKTPDDDDSTKTLPDLRKSFGGNDNINQYGFNTVTFVNGRYLLTFKNSPQIRWSGVFDDTDTGSRFPANWVATSEASADPTLNILFDGQTLVMVGQEAIELWQNNADEDPTRAFTRLPGGIINRGWLGPDSCCKIGNTIYGIQQDGTIWQISGGRVSPVTTTTQAQILSTPSDQTKEGCGIVYANLYSYRSRGNDFLVAQTLMRVLDDDNFLYSSTLVLDTSTGLYHTRTDGGSADGRWTVIDIVNFDGMNIGLRQTSAGTPLLELSDCYTTDNGENIHRIARTNPIQWKNQRVTQYEFELYSGFLSSDKDSVVNYRDSIDGGNIFSEYIPFKVSNINDNPENEGRIIWHNEGTNLGSARNRIIEISYSGTAPFTIYNSYVVDSASLIGNN